MVELEGVGVVVRFVTVVCCCGFDFCLCCLCRYAVL